MRISKNSKMMNLINFRLRITLSDSRVLTGQMLAFDKHMNLVLADCEEFRRVKSKTGGKTASGQPEREEKRTLGLIILRGEIIVSLSVDGPPPPSTEDQKARISQLSAGAGMAAPAGRGMPVVPGAAPGLTGPVRGVGGPAPGMMLPRGPAAAAPPMSYGRGMPPPGAIPPPGMPPIGFRPAPGMVPPPGMPLGMAPPPGFRPMGQPGSVAPPGFRPRPGMPPGAPPPGFPPGFAPGPPPPGFQGPPPGFRPPPPGFRPPQ
ncbi:hypothetical protein BC939DRAFT_459209 [Gamsiella multidivaricata]|uniref:uncharacterized protein n=1 Tax=Gamsiella multidivaricata TaxID=101098 RepID=UPI0022209F48|nr:uncharacterized protein BC939DRAFT_459209 [Gamsiella multidivaricata]KAI7819785.1 hypothetical protein BC939DRAFT_459209 [Gamsiella multidivaricata]